MQLNTSSNEDPSCYSSSSYNAYSIVTKTAISPTNSCSPVVNTISGVLSIIADLNSTISGLPVPPAGTSDQQAEYANLTLKKQFYIGALVNANLQFDTITSPPDTMQIQNHIWDAITALKGQTDPSINGQLIDILISEGQLDSATALVDTLTYHFPTDSETIKLCSYYNILIEGITPGVDFNSTWKYTYTPALETIAAGGSFAQAKAQSLLQYLTDLQIIRDTTDTVKDITILYPATIDYVTDGGGVPEPSGVAKQNSQTYLEIKAYPDPVTDYLQVDIDNGTDKNENFHLTVSDNLGKICIDQTISSDMKSNSSKTLDLGALASGMYSLSITDNNNIVHNQLIVKQ